MSGFSIAALSFIALFGLLAIRIPVGIAMILVGIVGYAAVTSWTIAFNVLTVSPVSTITNEGFVLITFFVLMGELSNRSGLSIELFRACNRWVGHFKGGLAMGTIGASGAFAAICGSSVATAATMTRVALPEMRRFGYSDRLATGSIAAGGTLGILIPPSIVLAIYGILTEQDIQKLFLAGLIPGLIAILFYLVAVKVAVALDPNETVCSERSSWKARAQSLSQIWASCLIFIGVIGGMFSGVFTPAEAAVMGAFLTMVVGLLRGKLKRDDLFEAAVAALKTSTSIFTVLIGSYLFSYLLAITQAPQSIVTAIGELPLSPMGILCVVLICYIILGCFLDTLAMLVLTLPVTYPLAVSLGFDPIWFGIVIVMTIELGLITPPLGMNVFVIKGMAPDVPLRTIFMGAAPFVAFDLLRLVLIVAVPAIALYLPQLLS